MSLYVIDDHPLMREAMVMLLRRLRPGANVIELSHLGKLAAHVASHGEPELFCLDLKLPDTLGVSGVKDIRRSYPHIPLAVISASAAVEFEEQCLAAGADIYIEKSAGAAEITSALRTLLTADSGNSDIDEAGVKLSKRQKQLIIMLDQGLSNREIATTLDISEHTVKIHMWRLFKRLGVNSRTQALHHARVNGLLIH